MTQDLIPDNGTMIKDKDGVNWLVIDGAVRKITDSSVLDDLFVSKNDHITFASTENFSRGADITKGSCLVRGDGSVGIFFVTGYPDTRRHRISTYEKFQAYGFNIEAVRNIPIFVLEQVPLGKDL